MSATPSVRRILSLVAILLALTYAANCGGKVTRAGTPVEDRSVTSPPHRREPRAATVGSRKDSEGGYCAIASRARPLDLMAVTRLRGGLQERADAVSARRAWDVLLREEAPNEIANAVGIVTTISDDFYDMAAALDFDFRPLVPDARSAFDNPIATDAARQYATYVRGHCVIRR